MTLNILKYSLLFTGLILTLGACTNSKIAKPGISTNRQTSTKTTSESNTQNGKVISEKYSYQFTENGCDTDLHKFNDKEDMCTALQDEKANNFCAPEEREKKFKENCSGEFKPNIPETSEVTEVNKSLLDTEISATQNPENAAIKEMKSKDADLDVFKMTLDSENRLSASAMTIVSCDTNPTEILTSKKNGILLLTSSKMILTRDLNYQFKDGSTASTAKPFSITSCNSRNDEESFDLAALDNNLFQIQEMKNTQVILDSIITSPVSSDEKQSGLVTIICGDDVSYPFKTKANGIYLTKGSRIVFARDPSVQSGQDGKSPAATPFTLVKCN